MKAQNDHVAFIALGSNLDDPQAQITAALQRLAETPQLYLISASSLYCSAPVGCPGEQPDFINAVAKIATTLDPQQLLEALLHIEQLGGRVRHAQNAARTLDLDLLLYDELQYEQPGLTIPHPRMHQRAFVLQPLVEIEPGINIPGRGAADDCLKRCAAQKLTKLSSMTVNSANVFHRIAS